MHGGGKRQWRGLEDGLCAVWPTWSPRILMAGVFLVDKYIHVNAWRSALSQDSKKIAKDLLIIYEPIFLNENFTWLLYGQHKSNYIHLCRS